MKKLFDINVDVTDTISVKERIISFSFCIQQETFLHAF